MGIKRLSSLFALVLLLLLVAAPPVLADDDPTKLLALGGWAIACLVAFLFVSIACGIYALYFLYTDAEARSGNGILWLLLGLFIGWPWVLLVWLIVRPEKRV